VACRVVHLGELLSFIIDLLLGTGRCGTNICTELARRRQSELKSKVGQSLRLVYLD
jgi:hypothetical protein